MLKCKKQAKREGLASVEELPVDNDYNDVVREMLDTDCGLALAGLGRLDGRELSGLADAFKVIIRLYIRICFDFTILERV